MEWTDAIIAELRRLWAEGLSTAEIGRRLGVSKNAIVGKAHRLGLDPRPSPIRRGEVAKPTVPAPRRALGPTLPPLTVPAPAPVVAAEPVPAPRPVAPPQLRSVAVAPVRSSAGRYSACCWPIGEPGTASFRFCSSEAMPSKPYCAEHASLAYVKVRDRREDAA